MVVAATVSVTTSLLVAVAAPASAGPSASLCSMNSSRGSVPYDFPLEACVDGDSIVVRNSLGFPVSIRVEGSARDGVVQRFATSFSATVTRVSDASASYLNPGDEARYSLGDGAGAILVAGAHEPGEYVLAQTVSAFFPTGAAGAIVTAIADAIDELNDAYHGHLNCLSGRNFLGQAACTARLGWNVGFAVTRLGLGAGSNSAVALFTNTGTYLSWVNSQPGEVSSLIHGSRRVSQAARPPGAGGSPTPLQSPEQSPRPRPAPRPGSPAPGNGQITLSRGGAAPSGFWYAVSLSGFNPGASLTVSCNDSVDRNFYSQTFTIDVNGRAGDSTLCHSADGPDHWVTSSAGIESNRVSWSGGAASPAPAPSPPPAANPRIALSRGGAAPAGSWYSVSLSGFAAGSRVTLTCRDSVDPQGFYDQAITIDGAGNASDSTLCYSGDGPDHWVTSSNGVESNHVTWGGAAPPPPPASPRISLSRGGGAPSGYWYTVSLSGFAPGASVTLYCNDSVDQRFYSQTFHIDGAGNAGDSTLCYSGDGPDHWVSSSAGVESNHVSW